MTRKTLLALAAAAALAGCEPDARIARESDAGDGGTDVATDTRSACPSDLAAARETPCDEPGRRCGTCGTDRCSFCNLLECGADRRWHNIESFPDPSCNDAGPDGGRDGGGTCWDAWASPTARVTAPTRPAVATSPALRLTFTYGTVGGRAEIVLGQAAMSSVTRPSDGPFSPGANAGSWVELRDASNATLYTRQVFELIPESLEGPGPDGGFVRVAVCPMDSSIIVDNVPNAAAATHVVFFSDPIDGMPFGAPTREIARFALPPL
jgi:hypothetical protein